MGHRKRATAIVLAAGSVLKCGLVGAMAMHFSHATGMRGRHGNRLHRRREESQQYGKQGELCDQATHGQPHKHTPGFASLASRRALESEHAVNIQRRSRLLPPRGLVECATFADVSDAAHTHPFAKEGGIEETNKYDGDGDKEKQVPEGSEIGKDEHAALRA